MPGVIAERGVDLFSPDAVVGENGVFNAGGKGGEALSPGGGEVQVHEDTGKGAVGKGRLVIGKGGARREYDREAQKEAQEEGDN